MKKVVLMPLGVWLLAIAAIGALVTPERGPFVTVLLVVILLCGIVSTIISQRQARADQERLKVGK